MTSMLKKLSHTEDSVELNLAMMIKDPRSEDPRYAQCTHLDPIVAALCAISGLNALTFNIDTANHSFKLK
jgi:hypothetical protein